MPNLIGKICLLGIICCTALATVGCGSRDTVEDLTPITSEPQVAPDEPTPTLLKEIAEPISPISPLSPIREPAMSSDGASAEPIEGSEAALAAAVADLSEQTGVPADEIKLVSMEAVEWNDASLGCPQEGFMYAQVITPGYLIMLEANGQLYEYHTDQKTNVVLCES